MTQQRPRPPQADGGFFLADGGLETTLVFLEGIDLPCFAAFDLLRTDNGRQALRKYFTPYLEHARKAGAGFVLDTPTWRSNPDWGNELGYDADALAQANRDAVALIAEIRASWVSDDFPVVLNGVVGPRGDGYVADTAMSVAQACSYHSAQISAFADTEAEMITAVTMTNAPEATGIALAAQQAGMPAAISFTVETDGRLPSGESLGDAIKMVEDETGGYPAYYMVNCAHPDHFDAVLAEAGQRLRGIRANASRMSHEELDAAEELDDGDPQELAQQYGDLKRRFPQLTVFGGCCGTDHRHIGEICTVCAPA